MATDLTVDDAIGAIMELIRTRPTELRNYGYDVYLPLVWNLYAIASNMVSQATVTPSIRWVPNAGEASCAPVYETSPANLMAAAVTATL